jgi:hypothetical protein
MDLIEFANEEYKILGKTISVHTLDGQIITGKVIKAESKILGIEQEDGFFAINTSAVASMFVKKESQ